MNDDSCSIEGCSKPRYARSWCRKHYQRWHKYGDPDYPVTERQYSTDPICSIDDCSKPKWARSWCSMHYRRWRLHGDPLFSLHRPTVCSVEGCSSPHVSKGYCELHYRRMLKHGDPLWTRPVRYCGVEDCGELHESLGYCKVHAARFRKWGDPTKTVMTPRGEPLAWLKEAIKQGTDECILFPYGNGAYGAVVVDGEGFPAHRLALILSQGPPPSDDHHAAHAPIVCHEPRCINPRHLRWATNAENNADRAIDGTISRGEQSGMAKLTDDAVRIIRSDPRPDAELAQLFGVHPRTVYDARTGRSWQHVA